MILSELMRTRETLNNAIAYIEADGQLPRISLGKRSIRIGEARAIAILAALRDSGDVMTQRDFEEVCIRNCRTLVGAGGFIARGSVVREQSEKGDVGYRLTDKGMQAIERWETRYGSNWAEQLESRNALSDVSIGNNAKAVLLTG